MREASSLSQGSIARLVRDLERRVSRDRTFPRIRRWTRELPAESRGGHAWQRCDSDRIDLDADTILDYFRVVPCGFAR